MSATATTTADPAAHLCLPFAGHARARGAAPALVFPDESLTWGELHAAIEARAREIAALPPGGVALRLSNSAAPIVLVLACARAGREAEVLDPGWPAATARAALARLAPALLVTECPEDAAETGTTPNEGRGRAGPRVVTVPRGPRLADLPPLARAVAGPLPAPDPESAFYVGFTSGSTGVPKGYRRSQRSWLASFAAERTEFAIGPADVVAAPGHFTHSLFLYAALAGLHAGARVAALPKFRPDAAARAIVEAKATVLYGVPTQLELIVERAERLGETLPSLRLVLSSGAKWREGFAPRLSARAPNALFAEFYGASELSFVALARADEAVPPGSVGRPFPGVEVTIRDAAGRRLPQGRRGLVHVASAFGFLGYACGDEAEPVIRHGDELSVGDAGFLDERGFLHLCGRRARMIVTSGRNVYPEEIERVIETHPDVAAAAVLGLPDARRGERLVAVVASADPPPRAADLARRCRHDLAAALVPRRWHRLDAWPLTGSGKTDFAAVARALAEGRAEDLP